MKIKNLLLLAAAASLSLSAFADVTTGEEMDYQNGQTTNDHLFFRNTYGTGYDADNQISFKGGTPQVAWVWLDDDEIYENEKVQALTPIAYNSAGDLYNEITYNSFQMDVMVPEGITLTTVEDEDGEESYYVQGDRLPSSSTVFVGKKTNQKVVDGVTYDVWLVIVYNTNAFGSHLSAKNASKYKANGALKKDDAPVLGLYMQNNNQSVEEGRLIDIIIGYIEFGLREPFIAEWEPNDYKFIYGTGGNLESNIYQKWTRVATYGSSDVVDNIAEKQVSKVTYYNIAGMESAEPFDGVNIQVTTYNDGTTTTNKVIK